MSYDSGYLNRQAMVYVPVDLVDEEGKRVQWKKHRKVWCNLSYSKGGRAMRAGELQAYEVSMFRSRYFDFIEDGCRIEVDGKFYAVEAVHGDYYDNTLQAIATQIKPFRYAE